MGWVSCKTSESLFVHERHERHETHEKSKKQRQITVVRTRISKLKNTFNGSFVFFVDNWFVFYRFLVPCLFQFTDFLRNRRDYLKQVTNNAIGGNLKDRGVAVAVDGDHHI